MQAKRFFFEKKKQKTFIHCRRHGVRTENSVPSETDKSFLVLFCKKERVALLRFQWVDLPGQKRKKDAKTFIRFVVVGCGADGSRFTPVGFRRRALCSLVAQSVPILQPLQHLPLEAAFARPIEFF